MAKGGFRKEAWAPAEPPIKCKSELDLVSSLRPIALCLRCFGFKVNWGNQPPTKYRLISSFYRLIWLLINMVAVNYFIYRVYHVVRSGNEWRSKINFLITFGTAAVQVAGTYGSLALATWQDGGQLAKSFSRIEARMPISKGMMKKIWIASITGAIAAAIPVSIIEATMEFFGTSIKYLNFHKII